MFMYGLAFILLSWALLLGLITEALAGATTHGELEIFTHKDFSFIAEDAVGLRFTGPIVSPLADDLARLLLPSGSKYRRIMLELNSPGGDLDHVEDVIAILEVVKRNAELNTRVMAGDMCASGCVAVFLQGAKRKASGASVWMFHGAHGKNSNVPLPDATQEFLTLLTKAGVSPDFIRFLVDQGYVTEPGKLWLSGYELSREYDANIITEILPSWIPEKPIFVPATPMMNADSKETFQPID